MSLKTLSFSHFLFIPPYPKPRYNPKDLKKCVNYVCEMNLEFIQICELIVHMVIYLVKHFNSDRFGESVK